MVKVTLCLVLQNWVTSYSLSYSNDTNIWFYYKDPNLLEAKVLQASSSYVRSALFLSLLSSFCLSYPFVSVIFLSLYFPSFFIFLRLCLHFSLYLSPAGFLPSPCFSSISRYPSAFSLFSLFPLSLFSFSLYLFLFWALFVPVFFALFSFFLCSLLPIKKFLKGGFLYIYGYIDTYCYCFQWRASLNM